MKKLKINNITPVQEDFWGNGAVYHGYAGMPDNAGRVYTEEQCIIEAERATKIKLKIARTFYKWWAWDENTNTWNWDNEVMTVFYKWLQRMKDGGVTVALNAGWCCPGDIDSSSWNGKSPFTVEGDWEKSLQNYADWVSETLHQLVEIRGFDNIKILVMFTEPNHGYGQVHYFKMWADAVKVAHQTLIRDGRRDMVKLMGANEGSGKISDMLKWVSENDEVKDLMDIYSSHTYQTIPSLPKKFIKTGVTSVSISLAGGRFQRTIPLKPNTNYTVTTELLIHKTNEEPLKGHVHFGVYLDNGRNDIHTASGCGPARPAAENSTYSIKPEELSSEFKTYTLKFNSGDATSGVIGVFHDILTPCTSFLDSINLYEEGCEQSLVPNGNFEDEYSGWKMIYSGGIVDSYYEWYKWAKTGLQYANGRPFCFDEYDAIYDRDHSRPSHGVEIVTAAMAMMNAGVQSSLIWTLFDQIWPSNHTTNNDSFVDGDHRCGVMPVLSRSLIPYKSYYAFALLSKYVDGMGTKVYEGFGENNLHTTMSVSPKGDITVVVANNKEEDDEFVINFEKTLNSVNLNRHSFDPKTCIPDEKAEIIGVDKVFENVSDSLSDKIAAYGVKVYTTHID